MKPKNIAFVVFEPQFSGQGRAVVDICTHVSSEFNFFLICQKSNSSLHEHCRVLVDGSLPVRISKVLNTDIFRALRFLRMHNVDLIHLHGFEGLLWGHALAMLAGIPLVFTPHTIDMKNRYFFFFFKIAWRICSLYASMLITVSHEDQKITTNRRIIAAHKLHTILLGVDRSRFENISIDKPHVEGADNKKWIVQVGHLSYQKNPHCFIRAAGRLTRKFGDLAFLFIGEGPLRDNIRHYIAQRELNGSVHVLGYRDDALAIMNHAWVVCNTSRWEGMPFTLIDACFLAKPIVAAAVNGINDLVSDGYSGLLFRPDTDEELAQKIHILLCHESLRQELGRHACDSVQSKFTPRAMAHEHRAVYKRVFNGVME